MANKIPVSALIAEFQTMLREHWAYDWSGAQRGKVSCAGAFVYAYKQHGISIDHGSNYMARNEVEALIPINVANIVPGMAAFKHREPGDTNYDLPGKYRTGGASCNGDLNDYYHVGLVDTDTSQVLNAQSSSTGFVSSSISKGWSHVAYLKQVDYGTSYQPATPTTSGTVTPDAPAVTQPDTQPSTVWMAITTAESGSSVNLRAKPSMSANLIERVPLNQIVTIIEKTSTEWWKVSWSKYKGYMMAKFLNECPVPSQEAPGATDSNVGGNYRLTLYNLSKEEAEELAARYPNNSPRIDETNG